MTDEQIIKALDCCSKNSAVYCRKCPYQSFDFERECTYQLSYDAISLINRQKAEIEKLKQSLNSRFGNFESEYDSKIKSEARREFAERLKEYLCLYDLPDYHCFKAVEEEVIDDLLKEMESESK